jgi:EAL domain-containing protein (putative c-di-GMP-specific phosphodiesterase class I)
MYQIKRSGRDGYAVFRALDQSLTRHTHLLDLLSRALSEKRIVVQYQPLVQVSDQSIIGVEALLRLRDDDGSYVPPLDFLPLARDSGTLIPIEHAVIRQACGQVARWVRDGHDLRVSVNVCAEQLRRIEDFEDIISTALSDSGLDAGRLVCEITEHALVELSETTVAGLHRLVRRGVRMSIDDFGTGFGSLTYLQALPVHELKIDRSFVSGEQATSGVIVRAIARLAADLEMSCVAEGVETLDQHELVRAAGIPLAQGFLYTRPVDAETLQDVLTDTGPAEPPHGSPWPNSLEEPNGDAN